MNGKLEGVLVQIESYEGSRKKYYAAFKEQEKNTATGGSDPESGE